MVRVLLLGTAQDGGLPQAGCSCANCTAVYAGRLQRANVVSLALIDGNDVHIIDASPDIKAQLEMLRAEVPGYRLRGVFLTHLHSGHYTGLLQVPGGDLP